MNAPLRADNPLLLGLGKLADLVLLSGAWALCCIPMFTAGPATAALYDCAVRCVRRGEDDAVLARFFRVFRANFRVGALTGLLALALWAVLLLGYGILAARAEEGNRLALYLIYAYRVLYLVPAGMTCWLFPLLSRFDFSVKTLCVTAAKMALAHPFPTLGALACTLLCAAACAFFFLPLFILPAAGALLCSFLIEPVFKKHAEET